MKKALVFLLVLSFVSSGASASDLILGLKMDAQTAAYISSVANVSTTSTADSMLGLGVVIKKALDNDLSLLLEALYNTGSGFNNISGTKTSLKVYPVEVNLQKSVLKK